MLIIDQKNYVHQVEQLKRDLVFYLSNERLVQFYVL